MEEKKKNYKDYFKLNNEITKRICIKCEANYSLTTSITTLKRHLQNQHKINFKEKKMNKKEKKEMDNILFNFFISSGIPFRIIENKYFIKLIKKLNNNYKLASRITISNNIQNKFKIERKKLISKLKDIENISITTDIFSNINNDSFLGITIHFIQNNKFSKY
jgi:hypothetical protein